MNILYVSSKKRWGGVVTLLFRTALNLEQRGHKIWIISAKYSEFTKKIPVNTRLIPKKFGMDFNPFMIFYLVYFIKKNKIDIIATNTKKEVIVGGIAAKICQIPCVRFIGNERDFNRIKFLQLHLIDQNILPCNKVKQISVLKNPWLPEKKLSVIYNGHNIKEFTEEEILTQKKQWGLSNNEFVIGITGRLVKSKGIELLIKAFSNISPQHPKIYLVISGTGKYKQNLIQLITSLKLNKKIILGGFTVNPLLSAAAYDIAILSSLYEAFPYTVIEYFAVGKPVISTNVGGVDELIQHGKNGFLIDINNEQQLTENLSILIKNKQLREQFSREALQTINNRFSEDNMIDELEELFRRVVAK